MRLRALHLVPITQIHQLHSYLMERPPSKMSLRASIAALDVYDPRNQTLDRRLASSSISTER